MLCSSQNSAAAIINIDLCDCWINKHPEFIEAYNLKYGEGDEVEERVKWKNATYLSESYN